MARASQPLMHSLMIINLTRTFRITPYFHLGLELHHWNTVTFSPPVQQFSALTFKKLQLTPIGAFLPTLPHAAGCYSSAPGHKAAQSQLPLQLGIRPRQMAPEAVQ